MSIVDGQVTPELAVIVPTYQERANLPALLRALAAVLQDIAYEIIIVDDNSPDGTGAFARKLGRDDPRIRVIRRLGRRGLATACLEGMLASSAGYYAVIDADLQHDPLLLPAMLAKLRGGGADIVVASRYLPDGGTGDWPAHRRALSRSGSWLAQRISGRLTSDPLSGFFMVRAELVERAAPLLSSGGFKILLDLLLSAPSRPKVIDLPYVMRPRRAGASKLDLVVAADLLVLLLHKTLRRLPPIRFLRFVASGLVGGIVHIALLAMLHSLLGAAFVWSQASAAGAAMVVNYAVNNRLTYRDRRLSGLADIFGLATFLAISAIGGLINLMIATSLFDHGAHWLIAGIAGAVVGAVWNYALSSVLVWGRPSQPQAAATAS